MAGKRKNRVKNNRIIIVSRASKLAMTQTQCVADKLKKLYPSLDFEIKAIKTKGDKILKTALSKIGDKGLFTKELEEELIKGKAHLAVHSMKDLPTDLARDLKIAAITKREDPRDVLVSKEGFTLKTLPKGSKVGTSSLRRRAQLLYIRKDVRPADLRGNLDTRIKKMEEGLYDAIIVAYAGIKRLGIAVKLSAISTDDILPQAGQGALAIETHKEAYEIIDMVKALDDRESHLAIDAERALLAELEGGCQVPIGAYAEITGDDVHVKAGVFSLDGSRAVKDEVHGKKENAERIGLELGRKILKDDTAREILLEVKKGARCD